MHLDEPVLVGRGAVDDEEHVVVVVVDLRPLAEVLGVLDRERVELEDVAQDRRSRPRSGRSRSSQKKPPPASSFSTALAVEVDRTVAAVVDDVARPGAVALGLHDLTIVEGVSAGS